MDIQRCHTFFHLCILISHYHFILQLKSRVVKFISINCLFFLRVDYFFYFSNVDAISMIINPLLFHISPQWKQSHANFLIGKQIHQSHSRLRFYRIDQNMRTIGGLNQLLNDIHIYKDQLRKTNGSIQIQGCSFQSKRCSCDRDPSANICQRISTLQNEVLTGGRLLR